MSLSQENVTWLYVRGFVDELARAGVKHVCLCPGSRSTPLAMTLAGHSALRLWMHLDERSCAFFALGLAKSSNEPVVLLCTSGTAAANFLPAIVEAHQAQIPLIVLTADRPPELRDTGAPQTIDQLKLYGNYPKWFAEMPLPEANVDMLMYARTMACRAVATSREIPMGVVHFNMPFREPLVPLPTQVSARETEQEAYFGRADGKPFVAITGSVSLPDDAALTVLMHELQDVDHGLIVAGMQNDCAFPEAVTQLADMLGYPILADPLSQVRCGTHPRTHVIDAYDAFLRDAAVAKRLVPEVVLRFGGIPTSKPLVQYLQLHPASRQILIGAAGWNEPAHIAAEMVRGDATLTCRLLAQKLVGPRPPSRWLEQWGELNTKTREAVDGKIASYTDLFEGRVFTELAACLPEGSTCFASSSMPVRDMDTFFPSTKHSIRFLSNRGANGIDGVVSSALGAAATSAGPFVLVIGDLALYHDLNGLLAAKLHKLNALVILIDNDGGGIFSFLPQAAYPDHFEQLFGTPHGLNFEHAGKLYDAGFCETLDWEMFRAAVRDGLQVGGLKIVQVKTNREKNVTMHRAIWQAVSETLAAVPAGHA